MKILTAIFLACIGLVGCNLFKSQEQLCLESTRLEFNDPDSIAVVQNLGDRGGGQTPDGPSKGFWLRYKAKNSYGAFVSKNMACKNLGDLWVRDSGREAGALMDANIKYLEDVERQVNADKKNIAACKNAECFEKYRVEQLLNPVEKAFAEAERKAMALVYDSIQPLKP